MSRVINVRKKETKEIKKPDIQTTENDTRPKMDWSNPALNSQGTNLGQYIRAYFMVGVFDKIMNFIHYPECYDREEIEYLLRNSDWGYEIDFTNLQYQKDGSFIMSYKVNKNNTIMLEQYKGVIINDTAKLMFFPNNKSPFRYSGRDEYNELCNLKESLNNIFFEFNSAKFVSSSISEFENIRNYFRIHADKKAKIVGHTSSDRSSSLNMELSISRAKAVYDYLVSAGIPKSNIEFQGKGDLEPIYPNDNEDNRKKNRRVELIFLD